MAAKKSRKSKATSATTPSKETTTADIPATMSSSKKTKKKASASKINSNKELTLSQKKKQNKVKDEPEPESDESSSDTTDSSEDDMKLTLEALDAMSDESEEEDDDAQEDDEYNDAEEGEGAAEAAALRKMIQDGKFDALLKTKKQKDKKQEDESDDDEDDEDDEDEEEDGLEEANVSMDAKEDDEEDDKDGSDESDDDEDAENEQSSKQSTQAIALAAALEGTDRHLPWPETFTVVPPTPLPFGPVDGATDGKKKRKRSVSEDSDDDEEEEEYVDIHDDLKREVAFYDNAMEAVRIARVQCEDAGIPFTRPEDFFAEMVKSDDHMAKIKDRLIFETKKMEAVERRKSNKEQTVMAKERQAHRIAEKAKAKRAHMSAVEDWKKQAEQGRGRLGGRVNDFDEDEDHLRGMGGGPNKKRMAANKKYGFGGKRGRFKQNDQKTLNDMSGFKPRGSFAGGQKTTFGGKVKKGGGGAAKRPGKRARDASKGRR